MTRAIFDRRQTGWRTLSLKQELAHAYIDAHNRPTPRFARGPLPDGREILRYYYCNLNGQYVYHLLDQERYARTGKRWSYPQTETEILESLPMNPQPPDETSWYVQYRLDPFPAPFLVVDGDGQTACFESKRLAGRFAAAMIQHVEARDEWCQARIRPWSGTNGERYFETNSTTPYRWRIGEQLQVQFGQMRCFRVVARYKVAGEARFAVDLAPAGSSRPLPKWYSEADLAQWNPRVTDTVEMPAVLQDARDDSTEEMPVVIDLASEKPLKKIVAVTQISAVAEVPNPFTTWSDWMKTPREQQLEHALHLCLDAMTGEGDPVEARRVASALLGIIVR